MNKESRALGRLFQVKQSPMLNRLGSGWQNADWKGKLGIGAGLGALGLGASSGIRSLYDHGDDIANYVGDGMGDTARNFWDGLSSNVNSLVGDDWDHFKRYNSDKINFLNDIYANPNSGWGRFVNNIWDGAGNILTGIPELPSRLWGGAQQVGGSLGDALTYASWR